MHGKCKNPFMGTLVPRQNLDSWAWHLLQLHNLFDLEMVFIIGKYNVTFKRITEKKEKMTIKKAPMDAVVATVLSIFI